MLSRSHEGTRSLMVSGLAYLLLVLGPSHASLRISRLRPIVQATIARCEESLRTTGGPFSLDLATLLNARLLKRKHYRAAAYLSAVSSMPILSKVTSDEDLGDVILSKVMAGVAAKIFDNIIDRDNSLERAVDFLQRLKGTVLSEGPDEVRSVESFLGKAENSALRIARFAHEIMRENFCSGHSYEEYLGQASLLIDIHTMLARFRRARKITPSDRRRYLQALLGRGIGNLWMAMDVCALEQHAPRLSLGFEQSVSLLRKVNDIIWRALQLNDDVTDLSADLQDRSPNAAVQFGLLTGAISEDELLFGDPGLIVKKMNNSGMMRNLVEASRHAFWNEIRTTAAFPDPIKATIDIPGYMQGQKFAWLFTLRKMPTLRMGNVIAETLVSIVSGLAWSRRTTEEVRDLLPAILTPTALELERPVQEC